MKPLSTVKGVDCFSTIRPEWAPQLKALGYGFAARYYRRAPLTGGRGNAVSKSEVEALHACGMGFLPVFQNTSNYAGYFTAENGRLDGEAAVAKAREMGQPADTTIFFAVDADLGPADLDNLRDRYFEGVHDSIFKTAYRAGVYGSGYVCAELFDIMDFTWLSNAKGWRDYQRGLPHADVVQTTLPFTLPFGLEVDGNECRNEQCLWMPPKPIAPEPSIWERMLGWFR